MNFTKTIINAIQYWINNKFVSYSKQSPSIEQAAQARTNIGITEVTPDDVIEYMTSEDIIDPAASSSNALYTDSTGKIYSLL